MDLTLKQMAERTGISYQTLSAWEKQFPLNPKRSSLDKISSCYEIPLEELIGDGIKVEEEGTTDYIIGGAEKNISHPAQSADKKALRDLSNLISEGTGLLSIGDLVSRIRQYGGEDEENELLDAQLEFQEKATQLWRRIRMRQEHQKKIK